MAPDPDFRAVPAAPPQDRRTVEQAEPVSADGGQETIAAPSESVGQLVGRYRLLQPIGEGGFGSVWMAEQKEPVKRRVALKIIKLGMDTRQVIARFEAERQALALMDHPNIARVLDAGATESGRPYFVMELVRGVGILEYCDTEKLDTRQRLALFIDVCNAIQHAHQKGIIHRDIKPGNVLVTLHDGRPVPKVIDFGIAKATSIELTDKTLLTQHRQMIGTPAYMSPEQAEMSGLDIDTRSDIYSLGVLLYELLTGTTPFSNKELTGKGFGEMLRIIRDVEPHRPSARLDTLGETTTRTAQDRRSDPRKLRSQLRGELDWIVMKCLEKDRTRRYDTANGLAMDLGRYLAGEPVLAVPPTRAYRLRKLIRRNQGVFIGSLMVVLALVLGMAGTGWSLVHAREQERLARREAAEKETARRQAARAQEVAERRAEQLALANELITGIFADLDLRRVRAGDKPLEAELGTRLAAAADRLEGEEFGDPLIVATQQDQMAQSLWSLGYPAQAARLWEKCLHARRQVLGPKHPDTLTAMNRLANAYEDMARPAEVLALREQVLTLRREVMGPDHLDTLTAMNNLAISYEVFGSLDEALRLREEVMALSKVKLGIGHQLTIYSVHNLSLLYAEVGRIREAMRLEREAVALARTHLGPEHIDTLSFMASLAECYFRLGRIEEARHRLEQAVALQRSRLGDEHPDTLKTLYDIARCDTALGRPAEALARLQDLLPLAQSRRGPTHRDAFVTALELSDALERLGRPQEALAVLEEALAPFPLNADNPVAARMVLTLKVRVSQLRGDAPGARAALDEMRSLATAGGVRSTHQLARNTARVGAAIRAADLSPQGHEQAGAYEAEAVRLLRQAIDAGYRNAPHVEQDPAFDALREREDFKAVLAELKRLAAEDVAAVVAEENAEDPA